MLLLLSKAEKLPFVFQNSRMPSFNLDIRLQANKRQRQCPPTKRQLYRPKKVLLCEAASPFSFTFWFHFIPSAERNEIEPFNGVFCRINKAKGAFFVQKK